MNRSYSFADLQTVVSDRIARGFNRSGAAWAVALVYAMYAGLLHKLKSYGISQQKKGLGGSGWVVFKRIFS